MRNTGAVAFVVGVGGLIAWAGLEVFEKIPFLPAAASKEAAYVDGAWSGLLYVETAIYGLVMAYILYCLLNFRRRKDGEEGDKIPHSRGWLVETAWILASTGLTLGLAALGAKELRAVIGTPEADMDVEIHAQQFSWEFYYPQLNKYGSKLFLERGKRHRLILTSKDVVHSFWVPELRLKQDAVPGKVIPLLLTPTQDGEYTLLCSQLCGMQHTDMTSAVVVVGHEEFEKQFDAEF